MVAEPLVIETGDLHKRYDGVAAVNGLTLQVPAGSICGFLGRNGAGKTTTIKMLLGMVRPTSGEARLRPPAADPEASVAIRRRTGFVSDEKDLYAYMTVSQMIRTQRRSSAVERRPRSRYLRSFEPPADRKVNTLSRGMRTKLALLLALCRRADLLVLTSRRPASILRDRRGPAGDRGSCGG